MVKKNKQKIKSTTSKKTEAELIKLAQDDFNQNNYKSALETYKLIWKTNRSDSKLYNCVWSKKYDIMQNIDE